MKFKLLFFIIPFLIFTSCASTPKVKLPFDFNHPAEVIKLPQKLHEIYEIDSKNEAGLVNTYSTYLSKENNCAGRGGKASHQI